MENNQEFKIKIPGGVYKIGAKTKHEAITLAYQQYIEELKELFESGAIYSVPEIYQQSRPHDIAQLI